MADHPPPYKCAGCDRPYAGGGWYAITVMVPTGHEIRRYGCSAHCVQKALREMAARIAYEKNSDR